MENVFMALGINSNEFEREKTRKFATDQYAFKDQEPLYKVVPFYIGLQNKQAYGIFFDNTLEPFLILS
jgi:alpha-glucosidase (family GH31 glycosyl hydrolase)